MGSHRARDLAKEAAWRRRVDRQADSGLSIRAWCGRHGVAESGFHWWRRELARRDAERAPSVRRVAEGQAASFVPVDVIDHTERDRDRQIDNGARGGDGQIEIELADGRRIRVTGTVHHEMLTRVLEVLTATSAVEAERRAC